MSNFAECDQFTGFRKQNCRHERLTPLKCDLWRISMGLDPLDPESRQHATLPGGVFGKGKEFTVKMVNDDGSFQEIKLIKDNNKPEGKRHENVGDILGGLFAKLGVAHCIPGGGCQSTKGKMNSAGIQGCKDRREEFIADIRSRAETIPATAWLTAAAKAVTTGMVFHLNPLDPVPSLYDYAIRLAEEQAQ